MSVTAIWDNPEQTVIRMVFDAQWTWEDLYQLDQPMDEMALEVTHKVCYIVDMSQTRKFPTGISPQKVKSVLSFNNPNTDLVVVVGSNLFIEMMTSSVINSLGPNPEAFQFATSVDEARARIAEHQAANAKTAS